MINKVTLVGRLGDDPKTKTLESGATVGGFSVATSENYKDQSGEWQENTEWHDIVVWRQLADRAGEHLKKGDLVYIEGKITTRKWNDTNGNPRRKTEVVANYFRRLNKRDSNYLPTEEPPNTSPSPAGNRGPNPDRLPNAKTTIAAGATDDKEATDDLPF